jgi:hypothetical protein
MDKHELKLKNKRDWYLKNKEKQREYNSMYHKNKKNEQSDQQINIDNEKKIVSVKKQKIIETPKKEKIKMSEEEVKKYEAKLKNKRDWYLKNKERQQKYNSEYHKGDKHEKIYEQPTQINDIENTHDENYKENINKNTIVHVIEEKKILVPIKKTNLSKVTITTYTNALKNITKKFNISKENYDDDEKVLKILYEEKENNPRFGIYVIRGYLSAISWYMHNNNNTFTKKQTIALKKYTEEIVKINEEYNIFCKTKEMTKDHKKNNLTKNEIIIAVESMDDTFSDTEKLILNTYINYPRRLDVRHIAYVESLNDIKKYENCNFYVKNDKKAFLVFVEFKNKDKTLSKNKVFEISEKLMTMFDEYVQNHNIQCGNYLFPKLAKNHKNMSRFLQQTFIKLTGKKISSTIIRHSFASSYDNEDEEDEMCIKMSHTRGMHELYKKNM